MRYHVVDHQVFDTRQPPADRAAPPLIERFHHPRSVEVRLEVEAAQMIAVNTTGGGINALIPMFSLTVS